MFKLKHKHQTWTYLTKKYIALALTYLGPAQPQLVYYISLFIFRCLADYFVILMKILCRLYKQLGNNFKILIFQKSSLDYTLSGLSISGGVRVKEKWHWQNLLLSTIRKQFLQSGYWSSLSCFNCLPQTSVWDILGFFADVLRDCSNFFCENSWGLRG